MQRLAPRLNPQRAHPTPTPTRVSPRRVYSPAAHPERQRRPVEDPNPQQREQADSERGRGCRTSTSTSACRRSSGYHCSHALLRVAAAVDIAI